MKNLKTEQKSKLQLAFALFMFGTIGIFVRHIAMPSSVIAASRGLIGTIFLLTYIRRKSQSVSISSIKNNKLILLLSGTCMGFNWILLFEAYRYTTVAIATLCYYMAPIFMILASLVLFKEKIKPFKGFCLAGALLGMLLVSGVLQNGFEGNADMRGILLGLGAAVLYASVILLNKYLKDISSLDATIVQLATSAIVLFPYILLTENLSKITISPSGFALLLTVGILHTGIVYALYFGSIRNLKGQTVALYSYIDPMVAILLSALLLKEPLGVTGLVGAVLILGSTLASELWRGASSDR
ncbi:MAG: EamA/RhaT family transporter [Clostridia bacterium]|nr:EamA/RhaT family transporter [Clostridia bacterium]